MEGNEEMEPTPIQRAENILRAVTYGNRSHRDALWLIQKAQKRHQAEWLREQVRKAV